MLRRPAGAWGGAVSGLRPLSRAISPSGCPGNFPGRFTWPPALTFWWFFRGLKNLPRAQHPPLWRSICFVAGLASFWIVLETRIDYYAQHMFFVHRWAHFVLHHFGAFFIALGMSGPVLWAGLPDFLKPVFRVTAGAGHLFPSCSIR
jgi:putative membrane protein